MKNKGKVAAFLGYLLVCMASTFVFVGFLMAAGTVTDSTTTPNVSATQGVKKIILSWKGSSGPSNTGSVPATSTTQKIAGWVMFVETIPGTTSPTDDYDITLTDIHGLDIMGGELANLSDTTSDQFAPEFQDSVYGNRFVEDKLKLNLTNNSVAGATGKVIIYVRNK